MNNINNKKLLTSTYQLPLYKIAGSINDYCERNPGLVFPSFASCAQFYECGRYNDITGTYLHECAYPLLYDTASKTCQHFTKVKCDERNVPYAPCQYTQIV